MKSLVKNRILLIFGLMLLGGAISIFYKFFSENNPKPSAKISNQVEYVDGQVSYKSIHTQEELSQIVTKIRSGTLQAKDIDENTYWELETYIEQNIELDSYDKRDQRLMHEMGIVFRATHLGQQGFFEELATLGKTKAPEYITSYIHTVLKEKECIAWDVPVYQLTDNSGASGKCTPYGIWIQDVSTLDKHNCSHEAGHWFYQHPVRTMSTVQREYEADNFAYECLPSTERTMLTKGLTSGTMQRGEPYDSNWLRIAKEHGEYPTMAA